MFSCTNKKGALGKRNQGRDCRSHLFESLLHLSQNFNNVINILDLCLINACITSARLERHNTLQRSVYAHKWPAQPPYVLVERN